MFNAIRIGGLQRLVDHDAFGRVVDGPLSDAIPSNTGTASTLTIDGASASSVIDTSGDTDWYRITLTAGQSYAFTMNGTGVSALSDPYLEVRDSAGNLVSLDDDGGPGTNSLMHFTATQSGVYYLVARAYSTEVGSYTISAATGPAQNPLDTIDLGFTFNTTNIAVYFATTGETWGPLNAALRSWTTSEQNAAMAALNSIAQSVNLHFTVAASAATANFIFALSNLDANVLGETFPGSSIGYLQFSPSAVGWTTSGLSAGGLGYSVIIHEAGHALGLAHPHYDGGDIQVMQGVLDAFDSYGTFHLDQAVFTVMSYNDGWPEHIQPTSYNFGYSATPMALDIALLQAHYGANLATNTGDTTYTLPTGNLFGTSYTAIWDAGGVDTIATNSSSDAVIDLRAATLLSEVGGGGFVSYNAGIQGGFTIANGVVIENATGGAGNDTLTGNDAANTLTGLGGNDSLNGGIGVDTLVGGSGDDTYYVDNTADVVTEQNNDGVDTVLASASFTLASNIENLTLLGSADINAAGNGLANVMTGNSGVNGIDGGAGDDTLYGGGGNDTVIGGTGVDQMYGGTGDDVFYFDNNSDGVYENSGEGYDWIITSVSVNLPDNVEGQILLESAGQINAGGNAGDNYMQGNSYDNGLDGGAGADTLVGGAGNDTLFGGGADYLIGGTGNDVYRLDSPFAYVVENPGEGYDWVFASTSFNLPPNVEGMVLEEAAGQINAGGNAADNYIQGNSFDNGLDGGAGADTLVGGGGNDTLFGGGADNLIGGTGNDNYYVDSNFANVTEDPGEGYDWIFTQVSYNMRPNVEGMVLQEAGGAINAGGNASDNYIQGNTFSNGIDGGAGADTLVGYGGNDTFVFQAGQANGDRIIDFDGVGAAAGDQLVFHGNGTAAQGATFVQIDATHWQINSADGLTHDILEIVNGASIDPSDYVFGP